MKDGLHSSARLDWLPDIASARGPKYLAIADALAGDIGEGRLSAGTRLPPQRALAEALGVDLTTVTRAYGEAQRQGLIEGEGRRGSFVLARRPAATLNISAPVETGMNAPPAPPGDALAAAWRSACELLLGGVNAPAPFHYQPAGGMPSVRAAGAALLAQRGIDCGTDTCIVTAGGQHGLHAIVSTALKPGDGVAVPPVVYPGFLAIARRYGLRLVPVAADDEGMVPEALAEACRSEDVCALYLVPTNDNPTTASMGIARREAIASIAQAADLTVIEDDAYGLLCEASPAPFAAIVPERTFHICSTSKVLSPGLRVAWVRAPSVGAAWRMAADLHETAIMAPPLNAAVVSAWLETGEFGRLANGVRTESQARQAIAARTLQTGSYRAQPDGYHLWLSLPGPTDVAPILDALRPHGLSVIPAEAFAVDRAAAASALRISTGGLITHDQLGTALLLLKELIGPNASRKLSIV